MDTQEARIYTAVIITVIVLGVIIGYFALSMIRQQRRNLELQKANALAEITAMEKERARIAADLHDDLGPVLSVVKFRVDNVELADPEETAELQKASQQLDELIAGLRAIANNLMPTALARKGLLGAVEEFVSNVHDSSDLEITLSVPENLAVGEDKSINIYRVIQELVHNCLKHAQATKMIIEITEKKGVLLLQCQDNGKGFDAGAVSGSSGIGLRSIRNRTEIMGGKMTLESKPGKGTRFNVEIPVR